MKPKTGRSCDRALSSHYGVRRQTALGRFVEQNGMIIADMDEKTDTLLMLTSFESFDTLARNGTTIPKIVERIQSLVHETLGEEREGRGR